VYIREAHPSDSWQLPVNLKDEVVYASPADVNERENLANVCVVKLGIDIDRDGRVAYKSAPGPFGFKPAEMEQAIAGVLSTQR
jgi:hypothetical protein